MPVRPLARWLRARPPATPRRARPTVLRLEDRLTPYAVNLPANPANPVHEDFTRFGYELFNRQFGDRHDLAAVSGAVAALQQGARDEDYGAPAQLEVFGDTQPSLRHFWSHDLSYNRTLTGLGGFNVGLGLLFEGAPGRAIRILGEGGGIAAVFAADRLKAARYIGHVAHLLQDVTVPAHAHSDPHLDGSQAGGATDFDPYHDYVDGAEFSMTGVDRRGATYVAGFDDNPLTRDTRYVSFAGPAVADDGRALRSPSQLTPFDGDRLARLFAENARAADFYDTKDYVGRGNPSRLYDRGRPIVVDTLTSVGNRQFFPAAAYSSFTEEELIGQADVLVPQAVRSTAEALRYVYSLLDRDVPTVELSRFTSTDPADPQAFPSGRIELDAAATDQDRQSGGTINSGIGKDKFTFEYAVVGANNAPGPWQAVAQEGSGTFFTDGIPGFGGAFGGKDGAAGSSALPATPGVVYAVRATAEDGGGNRGTSPVYYVRYGEPGVTEITVIDQSGSMAGAKLASAVASASAELGTRNDFDRVGVVSFSSTASVLYPLTTITPGSPVRADAQRSPASPPPGARPSGPGCGPPSGCSTRPPRAPTAAGRRASCS